MRTPQSLAQGIITTATTRHVQSVLRRNCHTEESIDMRIQGNVVLTKQWTSLESGVVQRQLAFSTNQRCSNTAVNQKRKRKAGPHPWRNPVLVLTRHLQITDG